MFVVSSDFDLEPYNIPNLNGNNSFTEYVSEKEEQALRELMGNVMYDQFVAGLVALPAVYSIATDYAVNAQVYQGLSIWKSLVTPNLAQPLIEGANWTLLEAKNKWLQLRDGDIYSTTNLWKGIKKLLIPYIYSYWVGDAYDTNSGIGVVKAKGENSVQISPKRRIVRAFNEYVKMAGEYNWPYSYRYDGVNTLYGFITANANLYPDFVYRAPRRMNIFNI